MSGLQLLRRWLACVPPALLAAAACAAPVKIELREEVLLSGARMLLSDVASVDAGDAALSQAIGALPLGSAPMAGYVDRRSRVELEVALRGQLFAPGQRIEWQGARSVTIRRESRTLDPALPLAEAVRHVTALFGPRHAALELTLATPLAPMTLPPGVVQYKARALERQPLRARMPVWVDVLLDGVVYRSVVVTLAVVAREEVYVARRALGEGATLQSDDVMLATENVAGLSDEAVKRDALTGSPRLRAALAQGQVLTARQVAPSGTVLRGDRVTLEVRHQGLLLEVSAVAQGDAQVGQVVQVKMQQGSEPVSATVVAPGLVRIDGR